MKIPNSTRTAMKTLKPALFLLLSLALFSCGDDKNDAQGPGGGAQGGGPMPVPVIELPVKTLTAYTSYPTSIEGIVNSEVRAKISGYITDVLVDEGQKVKKGQRLFKLETQSLNQDAAAAKANVNAAQVEADKLKPLVEQGIISKVQLETANAQLQQAKSGYNSIAANIDYANIKSPVDGYVGSIDLRKGSLISPSDQQPLTTVSDISKVYGYFSMNESDYLDFIQDAKGETMQQKMDSLPKVRLLLANGKLYLKEGTIDAINSQVNTNTGSVQFRAIFDNPSRILTNGNSGKVQIPQTFTDAVVVPVVSTKEQQGSTYVYKVGKDSTAVAAKITIKGQVDGLYIVDSGVEKGDRIVAQGVDKFKGETKIKPMPAKFDTIAKPIKQSFR